MPKSKPDNLEEQMRWASQLESSRLRSSGPGGPRFPGPGAAEGGGGGQKDVVDKAASGLHAAGRTAQIAGKTGQAVSKGAEVASKAGQAASKGIQAGGQSLMQSGAALSGTGVGAIAGVPMMIAGGGMVGAGAAGQAGAAGVGAGAKAAGAASKASSAFGGQAMQASKGIQGMKEDIKDQKRNIQAITSSGASLGKDAAEAARDIGMKAGLAGAQGGLGAGAKAGMQESAKQFKKQVISKLYLTSWTDFYTTPVIPVGALTLNAYWALSAMNKPYTVKLKVWEKLLIIILDFYLLVTLLVLIMVGIIAICLSPPGLVICSSVLGYTFLYELAAGGG